MARGLTYIFSEHRRHVANLLGNRHFYVGSTTDLRGRPMLTSDDHLVFYNTADRHPHFKELTEQVCVMLGMAHPAMPLISWDLEANQYDYLPFIEAPVHDREELEAWLEA